jgi:uncharacterized membrane protein
MTLYAWIKLLHVFLAIVAVGFNASYGIWLARAAREPEHELHVLRGIKFLDDRVANPAYGLLLLTGLAMIFVGDLPITTFWIAAAIVLWVTFMILGLGFYTPSLRRAIAVLEVGGAASPEYQRASRRSTFIGITVSIPIVIIVFLMVLKPTL